MDAEPILHEQFIKQLLGLAMDGQGARHTRALLLDGLRHGHAHSLDGPQNSARGLGLPPVVFDLHEAHLPHVGPVHFRVHVLDRDELLALGYGRRGTHMRSIIAVVRSTRLRYHANNIYI